ncbi:MAG TPA: hypothetical protein VFI24_10425 [Pyrinomonadaceae bacterium]|nr:hypothetical protein [Pyrinomonadaceae bacterium]
MFDNPAIRDVWPILWLKRVFVAVIVALLVIGAVSSHRAYFQVRNLELNAPDSLTNGSVVETSVVSSGRTTVDVEVDLIQGTHSERLLNLRLHGNELGFFDPRTRHASDSIRLTPEILSKFQTGAAQLRAVATGRHQWFRLPPPTVREFQVVIQK